MKVAVVGASGGIGQALVRLLLADERVATLHAFSRSPGSGNGTRVRNFYLDITDESTVRDAALQIGESLDLVIVATGVLHRAGELEPEKSLSDIVPGAVSTVMEINAVGPLTVAKHLLPLMRKHHKTVFAAVSARVGSIGDNRLGGWYSYRASKAALNMLLKTLSIEHARRFPESIIAGLHPGTVDTDLSAPFRRSVPEERLFTPAFAAERMLRVLNDLTVDDTGRVLAWDGRAIPN